jgi:HEAT repeat protein
MIERALNLIERTAAVERLSAFMVQPLRHQHRRIRSKAALLFARANGNPALLYERFLKETDARVRANLIEGLWEVDAAGKSDVLWKAARDSHHRVAVNALVGLCMMQDAKASERLKVLTTHESPDIRAAAAWAMGKMADPQYLDVLNRMYKEDEGAPKRNALGALVRIRQARQSAA